MRVVCDTNVLVSGILFQGNPRTLLQWISKGRITGFISLAILRELEEVLQRPKFHLSAPQVTAMVELVQQTFHPVSSVQPVDAVPADPDDNAILAAALAAEADCVISGDHHLLDLGHFRSIRIVSPALFLREFSGPNAEPGE